MRTIVKTVTAIAAAALVAATATTASAAGPATGAGSSARAASAGPLAGAPTSTAPRVSPGSPGGAGLLTGVRVGRHRHFDRVVFDVPGSQPGWNVRYVPQLTEDPSGRPLRIRGRAILQVTLTGVSAFDEYGCQVTPLRTLTPEFPTLRQVRPAGDFERVMTFGLGLRHKVGFRVFRLTNPDRVVVDVAHARR